ncbi:MAG: hypothetical protein JW836_06260 [Deltaproteobacteria bacterium]|nr:hypothetical protein [Deltaproteobacteria bacterium]
MSIEIEKDVLENACKEVIETILFCLPNSFKGTIYSVGKPPYLIAERITSGVIDRTKNEISWGLPERSEYNPPGKAWVNYKDSPNRPLEAMAWCVETQRSWTSADPRTDARSVRLQVEGVLEDFHHMEPVLVRKADLSLDLAAPMEYPKNDDGRILWQESDYVVVGVVKIHFVPYTIRIGSPETRVIKRLSLTLGTQLLSHHLRLNSMRAIQQLAMDRLNACNILADSLRNAITKSALIFSLVKMEMGHLREQWEQLLLEARHEKNKKAQAVKMLDDLLNREFPQDSDPLRMDLMDVQKRFMELSLPPERGEAWIAMQIEERWKDILRRFPKEQETVNLIREGIRELKEALHYGEDPDVLRTYLKIPEDLKQAWVRIIYQNADRFNGSSLGELIKILANPELGIPSRERSRKMLIQLRVLAENMSQLESNTNFLLRKVLNGGDNGALTELLSGKNASA